VIRKHPGCPQVTGCVSFVSNNSTIQQFNNSTIQQFNNSTIQQFNNSTIQQFNNIANVFLCKAFFYDFGGIL